MKSPLFNRVAILGLGLIGSSLARALTEKKLASHLAAFDISAEALAVATAEGFIHSHHAQAGDAVKDADVIIFAAPPAMLLRLARDIAPFIKQGAILTDVTSVKRSAIEAITAYLPTHAFFVPGHPVAGSEKTGAAAGHADLFMGKRVILTPEEKDVMSDAVTQIRTLWNGVGAKVEYMPADLHDRIYAYVSHLPQITAYCAWHCLKDVSVAADENFARFTRLAKSDAALWTDICIANADYIGEALDDLNDFAAQIMGELSETPEDAGDSNGDAHAAAVLFPKVIATCLVATASLLQELTGVHPARYAGSGFADMTAPAVQEPDAALAAISQHHHYVAGMLKEMLAQMHKVKSALDAKDRTKLLQAFTVVN